MYNINREHSAYTSDELFSNIVFRLMHKKVLGTCSQMNLLQIILQLLWNT